jgi:rubrerythrin
MKYRCTICGYEYDEAKEGVAFADLPDTWECPLCGAPKSAFEPVEEAAPLPAPEPKPEPIGHEDVFDPDMQRLSLGQMAALCSNLARGCEKQYMPDEMALFNQLAEWFTRHMPQEDDATVEAVAAQLKQDIAEYPRVNQTGIDHTDRGAQRVCTWGEKATRMLSSLMNRYQKEGDAMLADTDIWVCTVCGFVFIGKAAPELCPVCKVPSWKFNKVERRTQS